MLILALGLLAAPQSTWYVDAAVPGPGTGTAADPYSRVDYAVAQPSTVNGDTLEIADGTYSDEVVLMGSKELVLEAAPGATPLLVSVGFEPLVTAGASSRLTARGLRFESPSLSGSGPDRGGAIDFSGSDLLVEDCAFAQLNAQRGAAIFAENGTVTLRNVTTESTCSVGFRGGALWADSPSVTIESSTLGGTSLYDDGGCIFFDGGALSITDSTISGSAHGYGGALHMAQGALTLQGCVVTGRSREDYFGGGLYQAAGSAVIDDCMFRDCLAIRGGAIYSRTAALTLTNSMFRGNSTASYITGSAGAGGAVSVAGGTIERCVFRENRSTHHPDCSGGAISGRPSVSFCTFFNNAATSEGSDAVIYAPPAGEVRVFEGNILQNGSPSGVPAVVAGTGVLVRHNLAQSALPGGPNAIGSASFWSSDSLRLLPDSPAIDLLPISYGVDPDGTPRDAGAFPFDAQYCRGACDGPLGMESCTALANSTGSPSSIHAFGSTEIARDRLVINVEGLPAGALGYFIASLTPDYVPGAGGSSGAICVGGNALRFDSTVLTTTPSFGTVSFRPLLLDLPGSNVVQAGDLWYFQYWHRDRGIPLPTSNFSPSLAVQF